MNNRRNLQTLLQKSSSSPRVIGDNVSVPLPRLPTPATALSLSLSVWPVFTQTLRLLARLVNCIPCYAEALAVSVLDL